MCDGSSHYSNSPSALQLRAAVSGPDRYDPEINPTYAEMAAHYGMAVVPARAGEPRDKDYVSYCTSFAFSDRTLRFCRILDTPFHLWSTGASAPGGS